MTVTIDRDECISCGVCVNTCPEVFRMADDGLAEVFSDEPEEYADAVSDARDGCPVSIIDID